MEKKRDNCTFCHHDDNLKNRIIEQTRDFTAFMSNPRFRQNHLIVVPSGHYETIYDAPEKTLGKIMGEVGLLLNSIDEGYGTMMVQKFQPLQAENGIKMNHLHFHAWPRTFEDEMNGVLMPAPQSFDDFSQLSSDETEAELRVLMSNLKIAQLRRQGIPIYKIGKHLHQGDQ